MPTYEEFLAHPVSKKRLYLQIIQKMHLFGWTENAGPPITGTQVLTGLIPTAVNENDVTMAETASAAALDAVSVASVGAWYWDQLTTTLHIKPKTSSTIWENLYVGSMESRFSADGSEYLDNPYLSVVDRLPTLTMRTSESFDATIIPASSGAVSMLNPEGLFYRPDVEPDGQVTIIEQISRT